MSKIKTWQERYEPFHNNCCDRTEFSIECRDAEIADLRAALASSATTSTLNFENIENCFPEDGCHARKEDGALVVSAQWLHDFAYNIEKTIKVSAPVTDLPTAILALKPGYMCKGTFQEAITAAAALAKQVPAQEQDKIDAQRYRWLRDQDIHTQVGSFTPYAVEVIQGQTNKMLDGKELDEACDKAIAVQLAQSADTAEGV